MSRFNLNIYFALDAILGNPTLTQAARAINLSQPAMSLSLKRLREIFGDDLVRYNHGETEFTPLARQLRPMVADVLARSRGILDLSRSFDGAHAERTFHLMAPAVILFLLMPPLLAWLAVEAPGVSIETHLPDRDRTSQERRVDLSILPAWMVPQATARDIVLAEDFSCLVRIDAGIQIFEDDTYLAMDHAAIAEAQDLPFWPPGSDSAAIMAKRRIVARSRGIEALPHLAANRGLVVTAPARVTQHYAALNAGLISAPAPPCLSTVRFALDLPSARATEPAIRWFADQVEQVCGRLVVGGLPAIRARANLTGI